MTTLLAYPFAHLGSPDATEAWLSEVVVNPGQETIRFSVSLSGVFNGIGGVFRIRLGGQSRAADGLEVLSLAMANSSSWQEQILRVAQVVGRGQLRFKLTVESAQQGAFFEMNAGTLTILVQNQVPPLVHKRMSELGVDIWLGDAAGGGVADMDVTTAGDWRLVAGREAVKQSLRRRFLTTPGEYARKPDYGAGLLAAVKSRGRPCDLDDMASKLRAQALKDGRVLKVISVTVDRLGTWGVKYSVVVQLRGDDATPLVVDDQIPGDSI